MPKTTPTPQPAPGEPLAGSTGLARPHAAHLPHARLADAEWRAGRTLGGRTLYAVVGNDDRKSDVLIGHMDTEPLGDRVVADHNALRLGDPDELAYQLHEATEARAEADARATAAEALVAAVRQELERERAGVAELAPMRAERCVGMLCEAARDVAELFSRDGTAVVNLTAETGPRVQRLREAIAWVDVGSGAAGSL